MALVAAVTTCGSASEIRALIAQKVGSEGGTISVPGFQISIPSGALSEAVEITIAAAETPPDFAIDGERGEVVGQVLHFGPDGLRFNVPVEVAFDLPDGVGDDVAIMWTEGDAFLPVPSERMGGRLVGQVSHFSKGFVARLKAEGVPDWKLPRTLINPHTFWLPELAQAVAFSNTGGVIKFSGNPLALADGKASREVQVNATGVTTEEFRYALPRPILRRWRDPTTGLVQSAIVDCCFGPKADTVLRLNVETATWVEYGRLSQAYYEPVLAIMKGGPRDGALIVVGTDKPGLEDNGSPDEGAFKVRGEFFSPEVPEQSGEHVPVAKYFDRPPLLLPVGDGRVVMVSVEAKGIAMYDPSLPTTSIHRRESADAGHISWSRAPAAACKTQYTGPIADISPSLKEAMNTTGFQFSRLAGAIVLRGTPYPKILVYAGKDYITFDSAVGCWGVGAFSQNRSNALPLRTGDSTTFLVGGTFATTATAEKYDPATDAWTSVPFGTYDDARGGPHTKSTGAGTLAMTVAGSAAFLVTETEFESVSLTTCGHFRAHGESPSRAEAPHKDVYDPVLRDGPGTAELTVEAWVKLDSAPSGDYGVVVSHYDAVAHAGYMLVIDEDLEPAFLTASGDEMAEARATSPIVLGQWTHVAGVMTDSMIRLQIDGISAAFGSAAVSVPLATAPLIIGNDATGTAPLDGAVDEVRVSTIARYKFTKGEAVSVQRRLANDTDTVALFHFDEASGTATAQDSSASANSATFMSGAALEVDCEP